MSDGAGCAKPSTELFRGRIFGGGNGCVTRFQKAVAQGGRPLGLAIADNSQGDSSSVNHVPKEERIEMAVDQPFPMGTIKGAAGPGKNEVSVLFIASYVLASSRRGSAPRTI